jgi:hypothetical protein
MSRSTSQSIASVVQSAFEARLAQGKPFTAKELQDDTGLGKVSISLALRTTISALVKRLEQANLANEGELAEWRRTYLACRSFINRTKKQNSLIEMWIQSHIDDFVARGSAVSISELRRVCGGDRRNIAAVVHAWHVRTGMYTFQPRIDRPTVEIDVKRIFDERWKAKAPFTLSGIAADAGCSDHFVKKFLRPKLDEIVDRLLEANITTTPAFNSWETDYRILRPIIPAHPKYQPLSRRFVRLATENIHREGRIPSYTALAKLGCRLVHITETLKQWANDTGIPIHKGTPWKSVDLQEVLENIDPRLRSVPLTFLEGPDHGKPLNESQLRSIANIRCFHLRNVAFFIISISGGYWRNTKAFFSRLDTMMGERGIGDYSAIDVDKFYEDYHHSRTFPGHSEGKRVTLLQSLFRLLREQEAYLRKLTHDQRESLEPFLLKGPSDDYFWRQSNVPKQEEEERTNKRKSDVSVVHTQFYMLREVSERRVGLASRLREGFLRAYESARQGARTPLEFIIEDEVFDAELGARKARFALTLWRSRDLRELHLAHGGASYYFERRRDERGHPSDDDGYYLTYNMNAVGDESDRYWFSDLMLAARDPGLTRGVNSNLRVQYKQIPHLGIPATVKGWLHSLACSIPNLEFIPVNFIYNATLFGDAAVQIFTKTGARAHEFLQIRLEKAHLQKIRIRDGHDVVAFHAIPKGHRKERPFYIDERAMQSLHQWWKFQQEIGYKFGPVAPGITYSHKLKPANYLWQQNGRILQVASVNDAIDFVISGTPLLRVDGSRIKVTSHILRHTFATELRSQDVPIDVLALLLNQSDTSVTAYYSKPTPAMLAEYQRRIFEATSDLTRTHRRSGREIEIQLQEAANKVGALVPVVGGTCTVASSCPGSFACLGCFGNAPDPKKREQVIEYRTHYASMSESARRSGLLHEERKAMKIVSNCDDMLAEMDSILASGSSRTQPLNFTIVPNTDHS